VIIAAHGNGLRALIKMLDSISDADIASLEIPTGIPLIYELDDQGEIEKAVASVKSQRRTKWAPTTRCS